MREPTLEPLSLMQQAELSSIFEAENSRSADFCFGNYYIWDRRFRQRVAVMGGRLVTSLERGGERYFAFPAGSGSIAPAVDFMKAYCRENGIPLKICGICKEHLPLLGEEFEIFPDRDFSDYIYSIESLSTFAGKHLHGKKNFCNRFEKEHEWHFEPMCAENIHYCRDMLEKWLEAESDRLEDSIVYENDALRLAFENFDTLGLEGGILFADGCAAGFTIGEMLNGDTFCIHFEKAFSHMTGAYAMLCREMAKMIKSRHPEIYYVNREDDMGIEALRKSKMSYKPEFILEKFTALWKTK